MFERAITKKNKEFNKQKKKSYEVQIRFSTNKNNLKRYLYKVLFYKTDYIKDK